MLQGFEKIHYFAYSLFFMGKVMFIASVGALYNGDSSCVYYAMTYALFVFASLLVGFYDQKRTVGFGLDEHRLNWDVLAPVERHKYD